MNKILYRSTIWKIFFVLFFAFASIAQAACIAPGDTCSFGTGSTTADTCCSPVTSGATQTYYSCKLKQQLKASVVYTCQADAQQPGATNCAKNAAACNNTDTLCCKYDTDGTTPLQCNFQGGNSMGTCGAANNPNSPTACANEGEACVGEGGVGKVDGGAANPCCSTYNANKQKLTCLSGAQVVPADKSGTCGYTDLSATLPAPPSPPCITWNNGKCDSVQSAFGALSTTPESFVKTIFSILLSLSGGIALLLIMRAGYQMMVSQGKPEQLNAARDQLVAAIVGLVFLIFSFVLLQAIGFDLLKIPGFSGA